MGANRTAERARAAVAAAREKADEKQRRRPFGRAWRGKRAQDPRWRQVACACPESLEPTLVRPWKGEPMKSRHRVPTAMTEPLRAVLDLLKRGPLTATQVGVHLELPRETAHERLYRLEAAQKVRRIRARGNRGQRWEAT